MQCTSCGAANPEGTVYCETCGQLIDATQGAIKRASVHMRDGEYVSGALEQPRQVSENPGKVVMRLRVVRGGSKGRVYHLEEGSNLIGRWDPEAGAFPEVDLEAEDIEAKVSRKHALIERRGSQASLQDIGSLNGTFLNRSARLNEGQVMPLKHGDEIIIGKTFLRFEMGPEGD